MQSQNVDFEQNETQDDNDHWPHPHLPKKLVVGIGAIFLLLTGIFVGLLFGQNPNLLMQKPVENKMVEEKDANQEPITDWQTYKNEELGFEIKYPKEADFQQITSSPNQQYKIVYIGKKQRDSGRTERSLFDGYIFYISIQGTDSIEKLSQDSYTKAKQNCYEQTQFTEVTDKLIALKQAKTYSVVDCLGNYTENFVSNGDDTFELTQSYVGDEPEYSEYKKITDQILSTFKFTNSPSSKSYSEDTTIAGQKRYVSPSLGVEFLYSVKQSTTDQTTINVKEIANKIYLYAEGTKPESGQYLEMFSKKANQTLTDALAEQFLTGDYKNDCKVTAFTHLVGDISDYPETYSRANIEVNGEFSGYDELVPLLAKCPSPYTQSNGVSYFISDPDHPQQFAFISIGQYAIMADVNNNIAWEKTIKFNK